MSPIVSELCTDADFPAITNVMFDAMGHGAITSRCYPHNDKPAYRAKYAAMFLKQARTDPTQRWLKAVDTATGEIVGMAAWDAYEDPSKLKPREDSFQGPPQPGYLASLQEGEDVFESAEDTELVEAILGALMAYRREVIRNATGPVMTLALMAVSPQHHRRGAGSVLMEWGTKLADEIGAECVVEASPAGRLLYEKHGFVVQRHAQLVLPDKYANVKLAPAMMYRPTKEQNGGPEVV